MIASLVVQFVACCLVADFVTGVVHWWEDTYGRPSWPLIGPLVIEPNILHHLEPARGLGAMAGFVGRNYQAALLSLTVTLLAWLVCGVISWQLLVIAVLGSVGSEVHMWCHCPNLGGPAVRLLQEMAILQTPQHHAKHHRPPFDSHYCALTNVLNPALERLRFWRRLEALVERATGIAPKRGTPERSGV